MAILPDIFAKIANIAEGVGAADVAETARAHAALDRPEKVLVVSWPSTSHAALCDWLRHQVPPISVASVTADSANVRWPSVTANRVVAVISVGEFLDATQCDQLQELILARPSGTFRIVLTAAQTVDPEMFTRSEAGLRHLLQPSNKSGFPSNDATLEGFLFWMHGHTESPLADRLDRDRDSLLSWLRQPLPDKLRESLAQFQALAMLESLDEKAELSEEVSTPDRQRINTLGEQLRFCRRRMLEILERGLASVQRELTTSLSTLERDLLQDVRTRLRKYLHDAPRGVTREQLRNTVSESMRTRLRVWDDGARATLASRANELAQDTEVLLQGNDWKLLNDLCIRRGLPDQYPHDLLEILRTPKESIQHLIVLPGEVALPADWGTAIPRGLPAASASWLGAICGGAIAAASALWFFGPVGALLGGGLGAAGGAYAGRQLMDPDAIDQALGKVEQRIVETTQQALEAVNRFTREAVSQLRTPIETRFERIEGILTEVSSIGDKPNHAPARGHAYELARLREELMAGNTEPLR